MGAGASAVASPALAGSATAFIIDLVQALVYICTMQVNIHDAKTRFSALVERALAGERVVIARNGTALLSLEPIKERSKPRTPGLSSGKGTISEDFDDELNEEQLREFE